MIDSPGGAVDRTARPAAARRERRIRLVVIAQIRLYREGLADALGSEPTLEVAGTLPELPVDLDELVGLHPEIVLYDVLTPERVANLRRLAEALPDVPVVALAIPDREGEVIACAEAGVSGYVTAEQSVEDVVAVVHSVARGEVLCSPRIAALLLRRVSVLASGQERPGSAAAVPGPPARLTPREREIVELIGRGLSNKQIARHLTIEVATVKNHVHNILEKLHVNRREDAVERLRAQARGHLPPLAPGLPEI